MGVPLWVGPERDEMLGTLSGTIHWFLVLAADMFLYIYNCVSFIDKKSM